MAKADTSNMDFFEKVGYVFSLWNESWEGFKLNLWTFIVIYILPLGLFMVTFTLFLMPAIANANGNDLLAAAGFGTALILMLISLFIMLVLIPAQTVAQLASANNKEISFGDALNQGLKYLVQFIVFALVGGAIIVGPLFISLLLVFVVIGILLIPFAFVWAIVASFFLFFVPYIIVSENATAIEAMKKSVEVTKTKWQWVLAVIIVSFVISLASSIPLIGFFLGIALGIVYLCMPAIVYKKHFATKVKHEEPKKVTAKKSAKK
jgi:hypothetical protein